MGTNTSEFLARFFAHTKHAVELRALPSKSRRFTRKQKEVEQFIKQHTHENLYFGCATREDGGDKLHCREVPALWVDVDFKVTPEARAHELLESFAFQPSIVIESGGGWHVYFLLDKAISAHDARVEPILRGLAAALGADPAAAEIARVMRLPGTYNYKYQPSHECRILEANWDRRYALSDLERFGERKKQGLKQAANSTGEKIADGQRNVVLTSIAGQMRHYIGMNEGEILDALLSINARRCDPPLAKPEVEGMAKSVGRYPSGVSAGGNRINPWSLAVGMDAFLEDEDEDAEVLFESILFRETVTEIFSPRGIGKSLFALFLAVWLGLKGFRVLLLDRDNPRRVVRARLRAWGAGPELKALKVITREKCPPLTNAVAWAVFPYSEYDVVILDSLDAMAEGVGEQDSSKPSRAIAPLLDIARRENGPAVLVLGNCVKTGAHSRGSGVIEDRADVVYEVRDATEFHPSGRKPWVEELPPSDAGSWASRSSRRRQRDRYRLAFIPTKFRIGQKPEPFAMEINTTAHPWTLADVTDSIDQEGAAERERQAQQRAAAVEAAAELLRAEILRREAGGEPVLLKKQAEEFLTSRGIRQKLARQAINSPAFETLEVAGRGHPKGVQLASKNGNVNRNTTRTEPASDAESSDGDFGQPHPERTTEIDPQEAQRLSGSQSEGSSVDGSFPTPPAGPETHRKVEADYVDQEVEL